MEYQLIMTDMPLPVWVKAIQETLPNDQSQNLMPDKHSNNNQCWKWIRIRIYFWKTYLVYSLSSSGSISDSAKGVYHSES